MVYLEFLAILTKYTIMRSGTPCLYQAMRIRVYLTEPKARDLSPVERCSCFLASRAAFIKSRCRMEAVEVSR